MKQLPIRSVSVLIKAKTTYEKRLALRGKTNTPACLICMKKRSLFTVLPMAEKTFAATFIQIIHIRKTVQQLCGSWFR